MITFEETKLVSSLFSFHHIRIAVIVITLLLVLLEVWMDVSNLFFYATWLDGLLICLITAGVALSIYLFMRTTPAKMGMGIPGLVAVVLSIFRIMIVGHGDDDISEQHFKNLNRPLLYYTYLPNGTMHLIKGRTCFNGLIYKKESEELVSASDFPYGNEIAEDYVFQKGMDSLKSYAVWRKEGYILDFREFVAYKLESKK